jgi:hypothetical protein
MMQHAVDSRNASAAIKDIHIAYSFNLTGLPKTLINIFSE